LVLCLFDALTPWPRDKVKPGLGLAGDFALDAGGGGR